MKQQPYKSPASCLIVDTDFKNIASKLALLVHKPAYSHVFESIMAERMRQEKQWGCQIHPKDTWLRLCMEELGEVAMAITDRECPARIKEELVQLTALCFAWLEQMEASKNG